MTERDAIAKLADIVYGISVRCWESLGTDLSKTVQRECVAIIQAMSEQEKP